MNNYGDFQESQKGFRVVLFAEVRLVFFGV
jgi:hypothetical protein